MKRTAKKIMNKVGPQGNPSDVVQSIENHSVNWKKAQKVLPSNTKKNNPALIKEMELFFEENGIYKHSG